MYFFVFMVLGAVIGFFHGHMRLDDALAGLAVGFVAAMLFKLARGNKKADLNGPHGEGGAGGSLRREMDGLKSELALLREEVRGLKRLLGADEGVADPAPAPDGDAPVAAPDSAARIAEDAEDFVFEPEAAGRQAPWPAPHSGPLRRDAPMAQEPALISAPPDPTELDPTELDPAGPVAPAHAAPAAGAGRGPEAGDPSTVPSPLAKVWEWFTQGNTLARVGLVVLFFGLAFLLKYAADHNIYPIEYRMATSGAAGLALLGLGFVLRRRRPDFALPVQGGGVAVFYLTALASARLYDLLPPAAAFGFMAGICVFSSILAVLQRERIMALLSFCGGRLAPLLLATGEGEHIVLFSFYALLTLGEAAILRFMPWRLLTLAGFVFTVAVGAVWGARSYTPAFFPECEGFLIFFFLIYAGISVRQAVKVPRGEADFMDVPLFFAVPLAAASMQWVLMRETEFGMAFSCLGLGAVYLGLAALLRRRNEPMFEASLALCVSALTLAVPCAVSGDLTAVIWCAEGAALVWLGARLKRPEGVAAGLLLQVVAGILYMRMAYRFAPGPAQDPALFTHQIFIGGFMLAAAGLISSLAMSRAAPWPRESGQTFAGKLRAALQPLAARHFYPACWALLWWCFAGEREINRYFNKGEITALLVFSAATAAAILLWSRLPRMEKAARAAAALVPVLLLLAMRHALIVDHVGLPEARPWSELAVWLPALACGWHVLRRLERAGLPRLGLEGLHVGLFWTLCLLAGSEFVAFTAANVPEGVWRVCAQGLAPALLLLLLASPAPLRAWPMRDFKRAYIGIAALPLALFLFVWLFVCLWGRGDPAPLPYIPLLNPLDLTLAAGLAALAAWARALSALFGPGPQALPPARQARLAFAAGAVLAVLWLHSSLLRAMHHWLGIPFSLPYMLQSGHVQAALSIFWTLLGAGPMLYGARRKIRFFWLLGASVLGLTVAKLFLVDLSRLTGLERVLSFIVVGLLLLLMGWICPMPPRKGKE